MIFILSCICAVICDLIELVELEPNISLSSRVIPCDSLQDDSSVTITPNL